MKVNIRNTVGPWDNGFSLDKHTLSSVYTGDNQYGHPTFDTTRTEVGESLYRLKYRHDYSQVKVIANKLSLAATAEFTFVSHSFSPCRLHNNVQGSQLSKSLDELR